MDADIENTLQCRVKVPTSKSISNRLLMLKYSCFPQLQLQELSISDDTRLLHALLEKINTSASETEEVVLDVYNCGTAFRFLLPYLAQKKGKWCIVGSERIKERPIKPLVEVLQLWGAEITLSEAEPFCLKITGRTLHPIDVFVDISQSSQFLSALLLILPTLQEDVCLSYDTEAASLSYLQLTLQLMQEMGINICDKGGTIYYRSASLVLKKTLWTPERDWSSAAFWWAWVAIQSQSYRLFVEGLTNSNCQADVVIHRLLSPWGVQTRFTAEGAWVEKRQTLHLPQHFFLDVRNCLDLVPLLEVLCALLHIVPMFTGMDNLKLKESDRVEAVRVNLQRASSGVPFHFLSFNDHRIVMAFTLFSTLGEVFFDHPEVVSKSYPYFWEQFK